jgi:hypothetical protein
MKSMSARGGLILAALLVMLTGGIVAFPTPVRLHTRDINRDGRPDLWEYYDNRGILLRQNIDTNFDGKSDIQESYQDGHLVRRETDRNFDDQVDLTDEFDPRTGEHMRSVADVDFDGRADLLVLFSGGKPVFSEWARTESRPPLVAGVLVARFDRREDESLLGFDDPFSTTHRVRAAVAQTADCAVSADSRSMPAALHTFTAAEQLVGFSARRLVHPFSHSIPPSRPRGPPIDVRL